MSVQELAHALGVPEATIRRHLAEGAPNQPAASGEERLNLVHYAAWLNTEHPGTPPETSPGTPPETYV